MFWNGSAWRPRNAWPLRVREKARAPRCAAGLATVITVNDYTRGHDFRDATIVLDQLGEPDAPCTVLSGPSLNGAGYLGIEQLRSLCSRTNEK